MGVLTTISCISLIPALIIIFIYWGRFVTSDFIGSLKTLVFLGVFGDVSTLILASKGINNMPLFHFLTIGELFVIAVLFSNSQVEKEKKRRYWIVAWLFVISALLNMMFIESIWEFNSYAKMLESCIVIIFCLVWFFETFKEMRVEKLSREPMFIINCGLLLYFSGNFFIFTYYNVMLILDGQVMREIWHIHSFLNIIYNLLLALALWKMRANYQSE